MMNSEFELGGDSTNPRVESESFVDGSSSGNIVDSVPVVQSQSIAPSDNSTVVQGVESVGVSVVTEGSMESVSAERNVSDVNNRTDGDSNKLGVFESNDKVFSSDRNHGSSVKDVKSEQKKGKQSKDSKSKESVSPVYDSMLSMFDDFAANGNKSTDVVNSSMEVSPGHGFQVGDMVWGKVKSHPWWPGHVYSEEFATPSVRRSKREGLLLVAFFGDSSYGWFDPSELVPFDSDFEEKSRQTNSKTFVKAVEEAMDEVSRRSALGLSCMCRSKQNFRETDVKGYFAVDVPDYEPGAVYSIDAIEKARDNFKPSLALDFIRQLALEPRGSEHAGIDFIKNRANVISYRRAVYEEFDETYAQAFGYQPPRSSPGSVQELPPGRTPTKAPLSGRQVFADTSGKGKSSAKPNKLKDHAKKDKYLFKRRDEAKEIKVVKKEKKKLSFSPKVKKDSMANAAGDYVLQKRDLGTNEQVGTAIASDELASKDATMEDAPPIVMEFDPNLQSKVESPSSSAGEIAPGFGGDLSTVKISGDDEKKIVPQKISSDLVDDKSSSDKKVDDTSGSRPPKIVASQRAENGPKKVKVSKRPIGEVGSGKSVLPEKKKKRKKSVLMADGTQPQVVGKDGVPLVEKVSAKNPIQSAPNEDLNGTDNKTTTSSSSQELNQEVELSRVLNDLHSLACDPFHAINKGWAVKARQVFLKFRSGVFQKSLNISEDEGNDTHSSKSCVENGQGVTPVKPQSRLDDPTKGGRKRGPSDRQEEIAAKKKKKVGDIRNLTKEKKVIKKIDEPASRADVKQPVVMTSRKPEMKNTDQRAPEPTMLVMKFPPGGSLPTINELKARFARFGPLDHSTTRVFWNTITCRVGYKHKAHAQAAYKFAVGSSNLFGNTDIKCSLKEVGDYEPPPVKVPKEDGSMEDRAAANIQLKSCLKKSGGGEEAAAGGGGGSKGMPPPRVKFMLGGEENVKENKNGSNDGIGASSFSSSHSTMDFNSKNFQKGLLPTPSSTTITTTTTSIAQFTRPPNSMHYGGGGGGTALPPSLPPPPPPPPRSLNYSGELKQTQPQPQPPPGNFIHNLQRPPPPPPPLLPPLPPPKVDVTQQMLTLLTKCNDVVTNVRNMFGYVPYHPL